LGDIYAAHVDGTGTVGSPIQVTTVTNTNEIDAVGAYNPDNDQYLVVWEEQTITEQSRVYGRRMTGSGTVTSTDTIQLSAGYLATNATPDVVYLADSGRYLTAWQEVGNVYGRTMSPTGSLITDPYTLAATANLETKPRLTVDGSGALVVWQRDNGGSVDNDLYGRPLQADGEVDGDVFSIQETNGNQQNPAIAYGSNLRYQVAWQDDRQEGWDL
jgi:hypothetical protein